MLSHSRWTPRFLRIAPVDAGQQVGKLRRRDRHCFTSNRRPDKSSSLESFCEQACSLAIMPNRLQKIASAPAKAEQMTAERIPLQDLLHLQSQRREAATHVRVARRKPNPGTSRDWNHRKVSSPRTIRSSAATSTPRSTMIRRPFPLTISIRPEFRAAHSPGDVVSRSTSTGTNPTASDAPSRPSRNALRQENNSWLEIPCRRAVAEACRGQEWLSSTIRSFASFVHRRRRPVLTTSRPMT
ncbi:hypothetical protein AFEL58S_03547 [Afipia felis]